MSAAFAPPPPPPLPAGMALTAPQAAPLMNLTKSETYGCQSATPSNPPARKSQLLIDIETRVTLKQRVEGNKQSTGINNPKVLCNSNSNSSEDTNPVKNQLQAELCSTLKRRQNGLNKKPNFVIPKNSTINAIYNQLKVLDTVEKARSSEGESSSEQHTNGSSSKASLLPERANTSPRSRTNTPADTDKPKLMINHGRPNFVRPETVFKIATAVPPQPTIPEPTLSNSNLAVNGNSNHTEDYTPKSSPQPNVTKTIQTAQKLNGFTGHNKANISNGLNYQKNIIIKSSENEGTAECPNDASTVRMNGARYSNAAAKGFTKLSHSQPTSGRSSPVLSSASPLPTRKVLTIGFKEQDTLGSKTNTTTLKTAENLLISESSTSTSSSIIFTSEQNEIKRKLKSLKSVDMHEVSRPTAISPAPALKWTTKKIYGSQSPPPLMIATASPLPPRKAHPFKVQTLPQSPHITSPGIHHLAQHDSHNFDVKPIVSFSKDLCVTNRYPDQVKVLQNSSSEAVSTFASGSSTRETKESAYFSDLKFIINENGEVIHSSVTQQCHLV